MESHVEIWGEGWGGIAVFVLYVVNKWGWEISFTTRPFYPTENVPITHWTWGWLNPSYDPEALERRTAQNLLFNVCVISRIIHWYPCRFYRCHFQSLYILCNYHINVCVVFKRVPKSAKSDYYLQYVRPSVCPHRTTWLPLDGFSHTFYIWELF